MADLAEHARQFGVRWNSGSIAKIEAGTKPTVTTLVVLAAALESLTEESIRVENLLQAEGPIEISDGVQVENSFMLARILGSEANLNSDVNEVLDRSLANSAAIFERRADTRTWPSDVSLKDVVEVHAQMGESDQRIARSLDIRVDSLAAWSFKLWGAPFTAERDSRAGAQANAQKRGQITRQMKQEVQEAIRTHQRGSSGGNS